MPTETRSRLTAAVGLLTWILALLATPAAAPAGTTELVSVDSAGNQGGGYWPAISAGQTGGGDAGDRGGRLRPARSADGRFVAFSSLATNLVPGDTNGYYDVFVRDRHTGTTERVSVDSAGNQGDGESYAASISADGRFVAFVSGSTNLVPGATNGYKNVFVH